MKISFSCFLLLVQLIPIFLAKTVKQQISLRRFYDSDKSWKYIGKFGLNIGVGHSNIRLKIPRPLQIPSIANINERVNIRFLAYLDDVWADVLEMTDCQEKLKLAVVNIEVPLLMLKSEW